jgi:hypothetical protein
MDIVELTQVLQEQHEQLYQRLARDLRAEATVQDQVRERLKHALIEE